MNFDYDSLKNKVIELLKWQKATEVAFLFCYSINGDINERILYISN
jgi:hypothetical protein